MFFHLIVLIKNMMDASNDTDDDDDESVEEDETEMEVDEEMVSQLYLTQVLNQVRRRYVFFDEAS